MKRKLDKNAKSKRVLEFEAGIRSRIVGQDQAVKMLCELYGIAIAGLASPNRPRGSMLMLGPTGSGKTRIVEAAAEYMFEGEVDAIIKIDCAEYQHSHEIAKLIGSPPGYLGHRETPPMLTQENLDKYHSKRHGLTLVLFDEIEKASDALWQLLLGILDKGTLTLGDNRRVNFSETIVFMTSNLGGREMTVDRVPGFTSPASGLCLSPEEMNRVATEAARRKFAPEFLNRLDRVVVFEPLKKEECAKILGIELNRLQARITASCSEKFVFTADDAAKQFLLDQGFQPENGARPLNRAIALYLVYYLANLLETNQLHTGDHVLVKLAENGAELDFEVDDEAIVGGAADPSKAAAANQLRLRA
jgi:ATP-dependent Clp protease ATP-binding subunit ClpA